MDTERLVRLLAENIAPVKPLRRLWLRSTAWTALSVGYLAVLALAMSPQADIVARLQEPRFLIEQAAAVLTGLAAATAAFESVIPGSRRRVTLLPLVPLSVWIGAMSVGAVQEYATVGGGVLASQFDWPCVRAILVGTAVPGVVITAMLRRGIPLAPRLSAALGALAAAGLGNLGVYLSHPHSSNLIVLFWHCGTVLVLTALAGAAGAHLLRWSPDDRALVSP
jgi:hypothetical protein